jgi:flagellar M-ring protein FliF
MAFLNQSLAQLRDLFASMTPAARITSALLLGVIVVSLGYLFQGYTGASEELLFNGEILQPRDVVAVQAAVAKAGLEVLPLQAGRIVVPRGQKTAYLAAIADGGALPANFHTLLEESLDSGLWESGDSKKTRIKAAREHQLSLMVSEMAGIDDAKVLYDVREPKAFGKEKITATVSVLPAVGWTLDPQRAKLIRDAVAMSIAGLSPSDVMVLDRNSGSQMGGGSEVLAASFDDPYWVTRTTYETKMKADIEDLLRYIQPSVSVRVSAELDDTLSAETRTVKPEGDPAAIRERTDTSESGSTETEDRGQPGLVAQGPNRTPPEQAVAKNQTTQNSSTTETENFVPTMEELRKQTGLTPKHVHAAISVPSEYLVRVWRESEPTAKPDERPDASRLQNIEEQVKTKIKTTVARLLPKELAEFALDNVEVTVFQSLTPEPVAEPSLARESLLWASRNSGSLIMAGLAIVSLMMLRSMVKSIPSTDAAVALAAPKLAEETTAAAAPAKAEAPAARDSSRPRLRLKTGPTLKDDLTELVREDPDGAAAILRTWIGHVG